MSTSLRPGRNPLAYLGVDATTPPMMIVEQRDPTDNDYVGYEIGSLWLVTSVTKLWVMVSKNPSATDKWVQVYPGDGSGVNFFETNSGTAAENAGTIKIKGAAGGVLTSMSILDQVSLALDDDIIINNSLKVSTMTEGVVVSNPTGTLSTVSGTDRQFLAIISGTTPTFATLVSEDFSVTISDGTVPGTINFQAVGGGGGGGTNFFETNSGTASQAAGTIEIKGAAGGVLTSMVDPHKVTLELDDDLTVVNSLTVSTFAEGVVVSDSSGLMSVKPSTDLQLLVGDSHAPPTFATPVSEDFTVTITNGTVPGTINFQAVGGGGGSGFAGLIGENSVLATPLAEKVSVFGDELADDVSNIYTEASGHKINIFHSDMLNLGTTTSTGKSGVIKLASVIYLSAYGTNNLFLGKESGSLSLNVISAVRNVGIGSYVLSDIDTSLNNTAVGYNSLSSLDSGDGGNCCLGYNTGAYIETGKNNVLIGPGAGSGLFSNESYNILIGDSAGTSGVSGSTIIGTASTTSCSISGIYAATGLDSTNGVVLVDKNNKLGKSIGAVGQVLTSTATGVTWASSGSGGSHYGFYAYQESNSPSLNSGTNYSLGSKSVFVTQFNEGSAFFIGDGTSVPASYTAKASGLHSFTCTLYIELNGGTPSFVTQWRGLFMHTPSQDYFQSFYTTFYSSTYKTVFTFNFLAPLTAGDLVTWEIQNQGSFPGTYMVVLGQNGTYNKGVGTSLSGFLI